MSKILASIADAEWLADIAEANQDAKSAEKIRNTATAARAEHAEIVAFLRYIRPDLESIIDVQRLDSLLSRVGGGS